MFINLVDFAVPTNHKGKRKESEKIDKYLDLARELNIPWKNKKKISPSKKKKTKTKKLSNKKVTIILIILGALGTALKILKEQLRPSRQQHHWDWVENFEESWWAEKTCCQSDFIENHLLKLMWKHHKEW